MNAEDLLTILNIKPLEFYHTVNSDAQGRMIITYSEED